MFDQVSLIVHLGFDQPNVADVNWYQQKGHPYLQALGQILDQLIALPYIHKLEFLVSSGSDPLSNLQVKLDRQQLHPRNPQHQQEHQPIVTGKQIGRASCRERV